MSLQGHKSSPDVVEITVSCNGCNKQITRHINKKFLRKDGTINQSSYCPPCNQGKANLYRGATSEKIQKKRTMEGSNCRQLSKAEIAAVEAQYSKVELKPKKEPLTYYRELRH